MIQYVQLPSDYRGNIWVYTTQKSRYMKYWKKSTDVPTKVGEIYKLLEEVDARSYKISECIHMFLQNITNQ